MTKVLNLETATFDVGHAKYAAGFQVSLDAIVLYIQSNFKDGSYIAKSVKDLALVTIDLEDYPANTGGNPPGPGEIYLWQGMVSSQGKSRILLAENVKKAYALVMGQCSPELISKIKGSNNFPAAEQACDVIALLKII